MTNTPRSRTHRLSGTVVVHAATSANMLTAFGQVMAQRIVEEGAELILLASSRPIYGRPADADELAAMGGTPLSVPLENNVRPWNLLTNVLRLNRIFRKLKPHVVHTRGSVMGIAGRVAAWMAGVPCVVHHQDDLYARESTLSPLKRRLASTVERWFANRSHQTFVVSEAVADAASTLGIDPSRVTNVGHDLSLSIRRGAAEARPNRSDVSVLARHGITDAHFLVGAISRLEKHKGVDMLLQSAAVVTRSKPHARFLVRGRGPELEQLRSTAKTYGLDERFLIIDDWLADAELVRLYKSFDVLALPTRREGFGMVFAEAMLLGVVPIAPDIPPVNEVVTPEVGLLVAPNPTAFAQAIIWAIDNPGGLAGIRRRAEQTAIERWGGTRAADTVIDTYTRLLANRK